jgi:hypothetical protein
MKKRTSKPNGFTAEFVRDPYWEGMDEEIFKMWLADDMGVSWEEAWADEGVQEQAEKLLADLHAEAEVTEIPPKPEKRAAVVTKPAPQQEVVFTVWPKDNPIADQIVSEMWQECRRIKGKDFNDKAWYAYFEEHKTEALAELNRRTNAPNMKRMAIGAGMTSWFAPANIYHWIIEGAYTDLIIRLLDIGSNMYGTWRLYVQFAATPQIPNPVLSVTQVIALIVASIVVSFSEVIGIDSWAEYIKYRDLPPSGNEMTDTFHRAMKWFFFVFAGLCLIGWLVDLALSAIVVIDIMGERNIEKNPIGFGTGALVSGFVEFIELKAHGKNLRERAQK